MKRKLVKQGISTMMISLPSKWIKNNKLKKGDEIDLETENNNLVIKIEGQERKNSKKTDVKITTNDESSIRTIINNAYRLGYDVINIEFNTEEDYRIIKKSAASNTLGYEITEKKETTCRIESITEPAGEHTEKILLKTLYSISELLKTVIKGSDSGKIDMDYLNELEFKIYQYDNFVRRNYSKEQNDQTPLMWVFQTNLIHAQREVFFLAKYMDENSYNFSEKEKNHFKKLIELYKLLREAFVNKDLKIIEKIHEKEKELIFKDSYRLFKDEETDHIIIHRIASAIRNFYLCTSPLIGLNIWK